MESNQDQSHFEGWAIVEIFGHQRYAGYVTTEAFGQAVLFRVDIPALEPRERVTKAGSYHPKTGAYLPPGTTVAEDGVAAYTKLFGTGAIYGITPCSQEAAVKAVESMQPRPLLKVTPPARPALTAARGDGGDDDDDPLGLTRDDEDDETPDERAAIDGGGDRG